MLSTGKVSVQGTIKKWVVIAGGLLMVCCIDVIQGQEAIDLNQCCKQVVETHVLSSNSRILGDIEQLKITQTRHQWYPQLGLNGQAIYQSDAINLSLMLPDPNTQPVSFTRRSIESPRDQYKLYLEIQQPLYLGGTRKYVLQNVSTSSWIDQYRNAIDLRKLIEQVNNLYFQIMLTRKKQELGRFILSTLK